MYKVIKGLEGKGLIKHWTEHVFMESQAIDQLKNIASLPFIFKHVAAMPDVHLGMGATVGSVIATKGAVIPAAVGVDIGCGMNAIRLSLKASDLPDSLKEVRLAIEELVPVGFNEHKYAKVSGSLERSLGVDLDRLVTKHPTIKKMVKDAHRKAMAQAGTLGGGNHFIELCLDENDDVWVMLHSGSRGIGNVIGRYFIQLAKQEMERHFIHLPDKDLSYLVEGTTHYDDYCEWVEWAQKYASLNRDIMMKLVLKALAEKLPPFAITQEAVDCHHNYISKEHHFGSNVNVTRKGAVRARKDELGIIPGSMGAKSYIVRGKGNEDSFCSCSHGAGRMMSRSAAKRQITMKEHREAVKGVECRQSKDLIDESPAAYKDIDAVMKSQEDLVEIVHTLKQVICVKG